MKIVYCHCSLYNPGGMERVLLNKIEWLRRHRPQWQITVVTTDQQSRPPFYPLPEGVCHIDLGINYSLDNNRPIYKRIPAYIRKRRLHRRRLTELLMAERPDITVSLYPSESSFIPAIADGSRKVLELHFNRFFRRQYGRSGLTGLIDRFRSHQDLAIARRFDRFVVLTHEDRTYWGGMPNISVIPNAARPMPLKSDCSAKRVLAVGRLDYQKGFDRLIQAWAEVKQNPVSEGWTLHIFGQGEWHSKLNALIQEKGLADSSAIHSPTADIAREYAQSSILAMTSHFEGFPMVMIEAMAAGVPVATFGYKCGPRDIIENGTDGIVVPEGDTSALADVLLRLLADPALRSSMGQRATKVQQIYSEEAVMAKWVNLFESLVK